MTRFLFTLLLALGLLGAIPLSWAQQPAARSSDESSERTDESEEAYRRRMELEGARDSSTFSNTSYGSQVEQEKIDKLPPESQKNIRNQITDIIIENDQWEPSDVLEDYPYEPTEAAMQDPALREQEEEAWAEQVDKYHEREAAAFGATRPPMPGDPGDPGQAGSPGSKGTDQQQAGGPSGAGQQGEREQAKQSTAGGYDPNRSDRQDEMSTAGVSESALDFLRGQRGNSQAANGGTQPVGSPTGSPQGNAAEGQQTPAQQAPALAGDGTKPRDQDPAQSGDSPESQATAPDGTILIEQLDQLQGLSGGPDARADSSAQPATQPPGDAQTGDQAAEDQLAQAAEQETSAAAAESQQESENQQESAPPEVELSTAGIIAIRDLDKLEGVEESEEENTP